MTKFKPDPNEELRLEGQRAAPYSFTADCYRQLWPKPRRLRSRSTFVN